MKNKQLKKHIVCVVAVAILAAIFLLPVAAAPPLYLNLEGHTASPGQIKLYFNTNASQVEANQLTLTVGGEQIPIESLRRFKETNEPAAWLFMVDISGSIKKQQFEDIKAVLLSFAGLLGETDSAAFMPLGDELHDTPFVRGKKALESAIEALEVSRENTNLYAGIVKALDILKTQRDLPEKRQVVILSDGLDDFSRGYTLNEVNDKVKEARVPIHTIAFGGSSEDAINGAKTLGSFARASAGGLDLSFEDGDLAQTVVGSAKDGWVLSMNTIGLRISDRGALELTLTTAEGTAKDSTAIGAAEIIPPTTVPETTTEQDPPTPVWVYLSAGGGVAVLLVLIVLLLVLRRKKKKTLEKDELPPLTAGSEAPLSPQMMLRFTPIGASAGGGLDVPMYQELLVGRAPGDAGLALPDSQISEIHCRFFFKNERLYLEDCGSERGTYLNGVPIRSSMPVERDDVLQLGDMKMRVTW